MLKGLLLLDNEDPFADIKIIGYKRGTDPELHPAKDCGKFMIGDLIFGKYTAKDEHLCRLVLSIHPDPNPGSATKPAPDPMGSTTYPAIPTEGIEDHDWVLNTENARACGYTVSIWTEDRTIMDSGYIGREASRYVGFCLEEASK